jgi:hypothetical protein
MMIIWKAVNSCFLCASTFRFCPNCMMGKKVRVFWPVDNSWYIGTVQQFDASTGEHLLRYDDDDTEWVKIGENNTTAPPTMTSGPHHGASSPHENSMLDPIPPVSPAGQMMEQHGENAQPSTSYSSDQAQQPTVSPDHKWPQGEGPPSGKRSGGPSPYHRSPYQHGPPGTPAGMYPPHQMGYHPSPYPPYHPSHHVSPHGHPPPPGPYSPYAHPMMGGPPGSGPEGATKTPPQSSPSPTGSAGGKIRKNGPKAWTKEEDALLLSIVQNMRMPMKWSLVAQSLPERTGKQCRERYVNHLNPRLKITDWSPLEDATIFHLYNTTGSHWAKMSKIIPGRTDNGIKNRFHNLRRQLEREDEHRLRLSTARDFPDEIRLDRIRDFPTALRGKVAGLWDMKSGLSVLAAQSVLGGSMSRSAGRFGPFREAEAGDACVRCGFLIPSLHTGNEVCTKTGWCQSCARIPPHVSGNMLRECLNLRRCQDGEKRKIIESWNDPFSNKKLKETAAEV